MGWHTFRKGGLEHPNAPTGRARVVDRRKRHSEDRAPSPMDAAALTLNPAVPTPVPADSFVLQKAVAGFAGMTDAEDSSPGTRAKCVEGA